MRSLTPPSVALSFAALLLYLFIWISFGRSDAAKLSDYLAFYTAGRLPFSSVYDLEAQRAVQQSVLGSPFPAEGGLLPFNHPPTFVPVLRLLTGDEYRASYFRWTLLLWLVATACAALAFALRGPAFAACALAFFPLFTSILKGQDTGFALAAALACYWLLSAGRDAWAGAALSIATVKPHYALFLALPLVARPRALLAFGAASLLIAAYSFALVGPEGAADFLAVIRLSAAGEGYAMDTDRMFNFLGLIERSGVAHGTARAAAWAAYAAAAASAAALWLRRPAAPPTALTGLLAVIFAPHLHGHDLALLLLPLAALPAASPPLVLCVSAAFGISGTLMPWWHYPTAYACLLALLGLALAAERGRAV